jgi:hypothetical protein
MKKATKAVPAVPKATKVPKITISELNVTKAAARLLTVKLVSTEIAYVQRVLGNTATQQQLDDKVIAVRSMPWSSIAIAD